MSQDTPLTAPDGTIYSFDNLTTRHWLDGKIVGASAAAEWLQTKAAEKWKCNRDQEAHALREMATLILSELVASLSKSAALHRANHPDIIAPPEGVMKGEHSQRR